MNNVKSKIIQISIKCFLLFLVVATLFPFYLMLNSSFKYKMQIIDNIWVPSPPFHPDNYFNAFRQIHPFMLNSIITTAGIVIGVIIVATMAGYAFVRFFNMPGKKVLFIIIISFMMIPSFLVIMPQFILASKMKILNTYIVQILPPIGALAPLAILLTTTYYEGIPYSLFEAASIEGAGEFNIYTRILIPMSGAIIATVAIIDCVAGWNNYIWPLMTVSTEKVKPVIIAIQGIMSNQQNEQGVQLAGYVVASLPLLVFFSFATKQFVSGLSSGAIKA
jgi:ABC-type glycerol-3-phosphate transport system permease component